MLIARLEVLGNVDRRGAIRFDVDMESTARGMDGTPVHVIVEDFSRTGFRFSADVDFPVGTLLSIGLGGAGAREAQVAWREDRRHGCVFLLPLPQRDMALAFRGQEDVLADLEDALARLRAPEPELRSGLADEPDAPAPPPHGSPPAVDGTASRPPLLRRLVEKLRRCIAVL